MPKFSSSFEVCELDDVELDEEWGFERHHQ